MIEIVYQVFSGRDHHIETRRKEFRTEAAMRKFISKLEDSGNLYRVCAYSVYQGG
jgi:hypothetical protein